MNGTNSTKGDDRMVTELQTLSFFEGCNRRQLRRIDELSTRLTFAAGRAISRGTDTGNQVIIVCSGTIVIDRDGQTLATASAGEVVAAVSPTSGGPAVMHALNDCELLVIDRREFSAIDYDLPDVAARIRKAAMPRATATATIAQSAPEPVAVH